MHDDISRQCRTPHPSPRNKIVDQLQRAFSQFLGISARLLLPADYPSSILVGAGNLLECLRPVEEN